MSDYVATPRRAAGACASADPNLFFPAGHRITTDTQTRTAIQICARCRVRRECLEFAVNMGEAYGIWGGTTPEERPRAHRAELARRRADRRRGIPEQPAA